MDTRPSPLGRNRTPFEGTPAELKPLAEQVLGWVQRQREHSEYLAFPDPDDLRRIELMALAVREWSMFLQLYSLRG
jgi:hypothetical protein